MEEQELVAQGMKVFERVRAEIEHQGYLRYMDILDVLAPLRKHLLAYPPEQSMEGVAHYLISVELPVSEAIKLRDLFEGKPLTHPTDEA